MAANNSAEQFMADLAAIGSTVQRSTVQVREHRRRRSGVGSGVIWSADGVIITNAHVVTGANAEVELSDGRVLPASVIAKNAQRDLVALKIEATELPTLSVGTQELRVGELVMAVGNPLGLTGALTTGIIHSVGAGGKQRSWIQADIQLAPGNSGGPLVNAHGQVVGINTMIVNGMGFAVPSYVVQQVLSPTDRPYLGVTLQPVRVFLSRRRAFGLLITDVELGSPAHQAQLQTGDVLIGVRSRLFQAPDELFHILENSNAGDGLPLTILRGDQQLVIDVVICSSPAAQAA